ncbi:hypothetical protein IQE94_13595 [Synechocystis sp. PCC 7339]|uniref:hypothetical protein n=1 Tax=unclassified Synechocystis TaxID=2640012 RepID=UPI001BB085F4|nr:MULTISPECIES: hypothetical protein [unclassified Synechocystis]QUS60437.1 hypothetical protein HTZ78_06955 [Synechocystis sp. PCC 7338]UAJ72119.1 hypothetical protein IQE94_13595 [Synechocystis sp. PCC 7339]
MFKVEKSVQRQETKFQSSATKYRELSDAQLEVVCGGVNIDCNFHNVQSPESAVKNA